MVSVRTDAATVPSARVHETLPAATTTVSDMLLEPPLAGEMMYELPSTTRVALYPIHVPASAVASHWPCTDRAQLTKAAAVKSSETHDRARRGSLVVSLMLHACVNANTTQNERG